MRMGLPKLLTTDQGKEFKNNLDKKMTELLGIKRQFTTPNHPQVYNFYSTYLFHALTIHHYLHANGLDERWNQTLKNMIVKFVNEKKEDWGVYIDCHVFAYNTAKHASSLYSPFEVMFGTKAVLPIELSFNDEGKTLLDDYDNHDTQQDSVSIYMYSM